MSSTTPRTQPERHAKLLRCDPRPQNRPTGFATAQLSLTLGMPVAQRMNMRLRNGVAEHRVDLRIYVQRRYIYHVFTMTT
jgi:hypothetical protein